MPSKNKKVTVLYVLTVLIISFVLFVALFVACTDVILW